MPNDLDDDNETAFNEDEKLLANAILLLQLAAARHRSDGYWSDTVDGLVQDAILSLG